MTVSLPEVMALILLCFLLGLLLTMCPSQAATLWAVAP
jgi:hypothetical protein